MSHANPHSPVVLHASGVTHQPLVDPPTATAPRTFGTNLPSFPIQQRSPARISHDMSYFGGAIVQVETKDWSKYHALDPDGTIHNQTSGDLAPLTKHVLKDTSQKDALKEAGRFAMVAVKIYIRWLTPEDVSDSGVGINFSGAWLSNGFVLTTSHFFVNTKFTPDEKNEILDRISDQNRSSCFVSSRQNSTTPDPENINDINVFLWEADFESDIALFRTKDHHSTLHARQYHIKDNQLAAYEPQSSHDAGLPVWSVAYCGANPDLKSESGRLFLENVKDFERTKQEVARKATHVFGYTKIRYLQDLETVGNSQTMDILNNLHENGAAKASFDSIFLPNQRALAVGRIPNDEASASSAFQCEQANQPSKNEPNCRAVVHTISSFLGCSGAMVTTWSKHEKQLPVIIGLISQNIHGKPVNSFQAFTKSGVQWIERSMKTAFAKRKIPRAPQMKV